MPEVIIEKKTGKAQWAEKSTGLSLYQLLPKALKNWALSMDEMCKIVAYEIKRKCRGIKAGTQGQCKQQSLYGSFLFRHTLGELPYPSKTYDQHQKEQERADLGDVETGSGSL